MMPTLIRKIRRAYAQGYEELLDGIIFIDTRALFNLTVGVIDQLLSLDQAKEILFRKGRVEFSLERYLTSWGVKLGSFHSG